MGSLCLLSHDERVKMTIDEQTYRLLEVLGTWISGIGSLLAVIVALYLALSERAVRLKVTAGYRLVMTSGLGKDGEVIDITVANIGARDVVVTNVLWSWGILRRQYAVQVTGSAMDSLRIHQRLEPGHRGSFYIDVDPKDDDNWIRRFAKNLPKYLRKLWVRRMKVGISTAVGKTVWAPIEMSLGKELIEAAELLARESKSNS